MHEAYKDDKALCKWLRENSSGNYRLSGYAAERIETLTAHLASVQNECDRLEKELEYFNNTKNWTRPYNHKGELINEHALYRPKLKDT